ncbi:hypothetical protein SEA_DIABLA_89 [Gordonia phage Diabla]|nr:hypothetical protein SEA_DIABLA_89 [Gordonia phage Diabla]
MSKKRAVLPEHTRCRVNSHDYDTVGVSFNKHWILEELQCVRCGTQRITKLERRTGFVLGRRYRYPEGYQIPGGVSREQLGRFRVELLLEHAHKR